MNHKKVIISSIIGVIVIVAIVFTSIWAVNNNQTKKFATVNGHDLYKVKITKDVPAANPPALKGGYAKGVRDIEGKTKAPDGSLVVIKQDVSSGYFKGIGMGATYSHKADGLTSQQMINKVDVDQNAFATTVHDGKFKAMFVPDMDDKNGKYMIFAGTEFLSEPTSKKVIKTYKAKMGYYTVTKTGKLIEP